MLFNSTVFLLFLAVVVPLWLILPRKAKSPFLLAASYFFHGLLGERKAPERFEPHGAGSVAVFAGKVVATNLLVQLAWIFFRSPDLGAAFLFLRRILAWQGGPHDGQLLVVTGTCLAASLVLDGVEYVTRDHAFLARLTPSFRWGVYAGMWTAILLYMFQATPMPFIYFQF